MHGTYKPNTKSPSGNYEIIYGETYEFGMGGPYVSSIYLKQKNKNTNSKPQISKF